MDLRSGETLWRHRDGEGDIHPPLDADIRCDVAIVGGGITGALCAHYLLEAGVDVALVDRRPLCHGSTLASTGLLQYEIDTPLVDLAKRVGQSAAQRAYLLGVDALRTFPSLCADLGDQCELAARASLHSASSPADVPALQAECAARAAIGINVHLLAQDELRRAYGFTHSAALRSTLAMQVDPYRLALALIRRAIGRGLRAFGCTEIARSEELGQGVRLRAASGHCITARRVIFATGYETPEFAADLLRGGKVKFKSTFALASAPVDTWSGWEDRCLIWETARPYFYLRTSGDRAIMGGEDIDDVDPRRRDRLIASKVSRLSARFTELFPRIAMRPQFAWAGAFAESADGMPYIDRWPAFERGYFALGYGGNGITFSLIAARILRDAVTGRKNPDAALFRLDR